MGEWTGAGVFVERQYRAFASIVRGKKTHDVLRTLVERRHATLIQVGRLHQGRMSHVGSKPLYAAIASHANGAGIEGGPRE